MSQSYDYSFSVWPHETGWEQSAYALFELLAGRVEMTFTAEGFANFRASILRQGLTLREVERRPHVEPETVR